MKKTEEQMELFENIPMKRITEDEFEKMGGRLNFDLRPSAGFKFFGLLRVPRKKSGRAFLFPIFFREGDTFRYAVIPRFITKGTS